MRIVLISPPKSGASRLRCLLGITYGLRSADSRGAPTSGGPDQIADWLKTLPDDSITHADLRFHPMLPRTAADLGVTVFAIVRHPFDLFISNQDVRSNRERRAKHRRGTRDAAENMSSPALTRQRKTLEIFASDLQALVDWSEAANAAIRFEDILERPEVVLTTISSVSGFLGAGQISHAIELCPATQRIISSGNRGVRMAEVIPGTWLSGIEPSTLTELQNTFASAVIKLGYDPFEASLPR